MPQISKIRIVNFKYNDDRRFIPDELYDLTSNSGDALNSLFNLNNGGGKTVLVQLMMQPVNPKAMAGGRRIEEYFTRQGDHSFVLIEWTTDGSREKLLTGIAMAASSSGSSDDAKRGNSIRYYTFKTVYENDSPYSISRLELSRNEGGKYIPAEFDYVREKAKASRGMLEYYSSDESTRWARELSEYGILRTEWESVIEALNKDEGGLNQYFDEAKTSEKLINKFFIPAIEQKIKSVANGRADGSLETMLCSYAKRIKEKETVIKEHNTNTELLRALREIGTISDRLRVESEDFVESIGQVCGFKAALSNYIASMEADIKNLDKAIEEQNALLAHIDYEEKSKDYYEACDSLEQMRIAFKEAEGKYNGCKAEIDQLRHETDILLCAEIFKELVQTEGKINELQCLISEKENNSEDAKRIGSLKYSVKVKAEKLIGEAEQKEKEEEGKLSTEEANLLQAETELKEITKQRDELDKKLIRVKADLDAKKKATDELVSEMNICAIRHFDGFYSLDELDSEKEMETGKRKEICSRMEEKRKLLASLEERKEQIPFEQSRLETNIEVKEQERRKASEELASFKDMYDRLIKLCGKYNLSDADIYSGKLLNTVSEELELSRSKIAQYEREVQNLKKKAIASKNGQLHVLPEIINYVKSTGISTETGEEYLCNLFDEGSISKEKLDEILTGYPETAYSLLFASDADLKKFKSAGNTGWLPASVPLLTMEEMNLILSGEKGEISFLAAFDREYFDDRAEYVNKIDREIADSTDLIKRFTLNADECTADEELIKQFSFSSDWEQNTKKLLGNLEEKIADLNNRRIELDKELSLIKEQYKSESEEVSKLHRMLSESDMRLSSFGKLAKRCAEETETDENRHKISVDLNNTKEKCASASAEVTKAETEVKALEESIADEKRKLQDYRKKYSEVNDAVETIVLDGELEEIYVEYHVRTDSMSKEISELKDKFREELEKKTHLEGKLSAYKCAEDEYRDAVFDTERFNKLKTDIDIKDADLKELERIHNKCHGEYSACGERKTACEKALSSFGGSPLAKNEIGDAFQTRKEAANAEIKASDYKKDSLAAKKQKFGEIIYKIEYTLGEIKYGEVYKVVELNETPEEQWDFLKRQLDMSQKAFNSTKERLDNGIKDIVSEYKNIAIAEIVNRLVDIKKLIEDAGIKGDRLLTARESISMMIDSIEKINSQIETDLKEIENDFSDILNQCMNQGRRMYADLKQIASSSKANIFKGKPQTQMVKMDLPEENEISEEASKAKIRTELENGANEIKVLIEREAEDKEILKHAKKIVSSQNLLLRYIGKNSIQVSVYKIDLTSTNSGYKRWEDTLTQSSGAEKFVVFFAVVLTLMNYTRSSEGLAGKNTKSVLILDNPFGKITSAHLLKPMFDIAKHFNVQLICLSDINKSDVINCFDCVIKLVIKSRNLSNFDILTHEGNEQIEHGYYKIMNGQMSFF